MRRRGFLAGAAMALLSFAPLLSCAKRETPEARLRALIAAAEAATERRDAAALRAMVSERYTDDEGRDRRAIEGILRVHFLRHQSIHLLVRVHAIAIPAPSRAQATVFVAMAGQPLPDFSDLPRLHADLHRFDLEFADEAGEWRLVGAHWRRAELSDLSP